MEYSKKEYFGLGKVPTGIGAVLRGWDLTEEEFRDDFRLPVVDFRAMTHACPHNCFYCFTDKLCNTLTLEDIKRVIDELAELNTHAIDFLGEGEPTIDKDFFEIVEYTQSKGIQAVVFTDVATKLRDEDFIDRLFKSGATIISKCDSLFNAEYQNWVVGDKKEKFFEERNEAIKKLIKKNFNEIIKDGTTRLGFDMVISRKNMHEVEKTLRYCRENNLWIVFAFYLPSGRSGMEEFDKSLMLNNKEKRKVWDLIQKIDKDYGFEHKSINNFATSHCVEFIQIYGDGRVSPCPGNETIIGNVKEKSIKELKDLILEKFPCHNRKTFDGFCPYRERF
jgi:MoaA/NifB/PqqE/SkfB family radical SAM enzyme